MINFVIIGGGWRAEFYLRIAKSLPEQFKVSGICVRNPERAQYILENYSVKVVSSVEELLKEPFDFVVNCINKEDISDLSLELADRGYFVLSETPVIKDLESGHAYEKIQVAEQFHLKGTYQAMKKIIDSGLIGEVNHINISVAHDYHAMSLVRFFLHDYEKPQLLYGHDFEDKMLHTNGRIGVLPEKKLESTTQTMRVYQFCNATVVYDYNIEQYFSPIRRDRLLIRGTRGEIENNCVRYFNAENQPVSSEIKVTTAGLLDGFYLNNITFDDKVLFDFPFQHARLSEEEIAIAQCLLDMSNYIKTGTELYHYERAYKDYAFFNL